MRATTEFNCEIFRTNTLEIWSDCLDLGSMSARIFLTTAALLFVSAEARAIQLDDPVNFQVVQTWTGQSIGVPGRLGAMLFINNGDTLLIVGDAEATNSAVYSVPVIRDPITRRVTGFGTATLVFSGNPLTAGIDAGMELGPSGTLFYTYWDAHRVAQRTTLTSTTEVSFDMTPTGVPSSVAGLAFSPHLVDPATGFGQLQVSSWLGNGVYNVPLTPAGGGVYTPGMATLFVSLPQQGTGAIQYIPQGLYTGNMMYVNWDFGEVRMVVIDRATGLPIDDTTGQPTLGTTNPRDIRFAYEIGVGPWGLEFDPQTLDFFVSTWNGNPANSIIQFSGPGFANQPPIAFAQSATTTRGTPIVLTLNASDPDLDPLSFQIVQLPANGTLTGTTGVVTYQPNAGFTGGDSFTFRASDGQLFSNTATVTIFVREGSPIDAGVEDSGAAEDAAANEDASTQDAATGQDAAGNDAATPRPDAGAGNTDAATTRDASTANDAGTTNDGGGDGCDCRTNNRSHEGGLTILAFFAALLFLRRRS